MNRSAPEDQKVFPQEKTQQTAVPGLPKLPMNCLTVVLYHNFTTGSALSHTRAAYPVRGPERVQVDGGGPAPVMEGGQNENHIGRTVCLQCDNPALPVPVDTR